MSNRRDQFKGSVEGWEDLVGGRIKNPAKKDGFDDGTGSRGGPPKGDRPRHQKPEALPSVTNNEKGDKMTTAPTKTPAIRPNPAMDNMESCPVCGGSKYKEATFNEGGEKKTVKILVCASCTARYKAYQEEVRATNIKTIVANPTAPEPAGPMDKLHWVLGQIDLAKFEAEAKAAEAAYRTKYDEVVVKVLSGRGYLVGTPEWKGTGTSRPVTRFTGAAFAGIGPDLRTALEEQIKDLRWAMKKLAGRLEAATRVKAELEAELAKNAPAPAAAPAVTVTENLAPVETVKKSKKSK